MDENSCSKEKLVVEVIGAHNLMPKDGEGSSSPFVEVEFDNQRLKTQVKFKDLNPIWNKKLVFDVKNVADLPYRTIKISVFNEKRSSNSRNFLGEVRVSGSAIVKEGEELVQLYTLDKRSLFSHVRGEISLKFHLSTGENIKSLGSNGVVAKKSKKLQGPTSTVAVQNQVSQVNEQKQHVRGPLKSLDPGLTDMKPVVVTTATSPAIPTAGSGVAEFSLKETRPILGGESAAIRKNNTYDLVEQMQYLYVKVVKARDISLFRTADLMAEVKLGNYKGITKRVSSTSNIEFDQVFAFSKDCIHSSMVEIFVKESNKEEYMGRVWFDLNEVPSRVPPDSQLAPQWYKMEDKKGEKGKPGEIMVSIWFGTQADEAFSEAWHSKAANVHFDGLSSIKSKVYLSPKLWYLRISVIEAQDVVVCGEKGSQIMRFPELSAKVQVGNQVLKTRIAQPTPNRSLSSPFWNEELLFVVSEPFEDYIMVLIEDRIGPTRDDVLGRFVLPISAIEQRTNEKPVVSRWFSLENHFGNNNESKITMRFGSRIHLSLSLDGGYHVLDEATMYSSEFRPTAKQLWKPHIGVLEMGILGATRLMPMKIKEGKPSGSTDAYCVAKYGQKWIRTRTVVDSFSPKWNEQYTWEVFDPCTVITIGVFDNSRIEKSLISRDARIGKVRIRLSTLEMDRVYTHSYPLLMLLPSGVKKMGELHLAMRFSCANMVNVLHMYTKPLLPKMHFVQPLSVNQLESLRYRAMNVVSARLSRAEPALGREVVEYMLDHDSNMWSMRRSKTNFFRLMSVLSGVVSIIRTLDALRAWNKPIYTAIFLAFYLMLVAFPELIVPTVLLYTAFLGMWRYRSRPRHPTHMDARLSHAESVFPDELDEEFDSFPTSRSAEIVRMRYDRLRSVSGKIQTMVGDMATQAERFQALLSWRDPRATFLFSIFSLLAAVGFYAVPNKVVVGVCGVYLFRPPRFRSKLPSQALSFFRRLPSNADSLL